MAVMFGHIHHIAAVNGDTGGPVQFSVATALLSKLPQKSSLCCEYLNTMVATISNIHIPSAVTCHIPGALELSIATALTAKAAGECQIRVQNLNAVVVTFNYIQFLALWMKCNRDRGPKFQGLPS